MNHCSWKRPLTSLSAIFKKGGKVIAMSQEPGSSKSILNLGLLAIIMSIKATLEPLAAPSSPWLIPQRKTHTQLGASVSKATENDSHSPQHTHSGPELWQLWSVWELPPAASPQLVYPVGTFNKEPVKKATVTEHSLSVRQSGWIMVLIINYWGGEGGRRAGLN